MSDAVARVEPDSRKPIGMTERTVAGIREVLGGGSTLAQPASACGARGGRLDRLYGSRAISPPTSRPGPRYGYALLWVVLTASLAAMLFQSLSAKLGIVTGRKLAELCREHFPNRWYGRFGSSARSARRWRPTSPEFLGGCDWSFAPAAYPAARCGMGVTGVLTYGILMFEGRGFRPDRTHHRHARFVAAIALCYLVEMVIAPGLIGPRRGWAAWFQACPTPAR